jgi:hypothetical protein
MIWYCSYLPDFNITRFNWAIILLLGFEIVYIAIQAGRGQLSHYNQTSSFYSFLYGCMAMAATLVTIYTAYVGYLFFVNDFPELPNYYLWAIRLGIFIFVIFSFEGFVMGSRLTHTIGGPDGEAGIPIVSFYLLKNTKATIVLALLYFALAVFTLVQALQGRSMFKS